MRSSAGSRLILSASSNLMHSVGSIVRITSCMILFLELSCHSSLSYGFSDTASSFIVLRCTFATIPRKKNNMGMCRMAFPTTTRIATKTRITAVTTRMGKMAVIGPMERIGQMERIGRVEFTGRMDPKTTTKLQRERIATLPKRREYTTNLANLNAIILWTTKLSSTRDYYTDNSDYVPPTKKSRFWRRRKKHKELQPKKQQQQQQQQPFTEFVSSLDNRSKVLLTSSRLAGFRGNNSCDTHNNYNIYNNYKGKEDLNGDRNGGDLSRDFHGELNGIVQEDLNGAVNGSGGDNRCTILPDSIEMYANDIAIVLKILRSEELDPTIPRTFRIGRMPSFTRTWSFEDWKRHTSRWRYLNYITTLPTSNLLRRLFPSLTALLLWSMLASWACTHEIAPLKRAVLSLTPLSLVSTFVAALLTLRSNQGLSRLNDGRLAFGKVVLYTRDMAQMISAHVYPKDPLLGLKLARHMAIFAWLLKGFLRGKKANGGYDEDIIRTMLDPVDADYVLQQRKKPAAVVTRLRQGFSLMLQQGQLTTSEASRLDHTAQQLNTCITVTERIQASPIPPLYTAHTGRLLIFYLVFLPLSLRGSNMLNTIGTVITTMAVGYAMLGLDEISHLVEEPFRLMPLWHLSKNSMMDCADAIVCQPPPLVPLAKRPPPQTNHAITPKVTAAATTATNTNPPLFQPPLYW